MSQSISGKAKKITWLLAMVYFASYLMRKNFSVMLAAIVAAGYDEVKLGVVGTALTISYGAGQIVNGILGDKIKPQYMLTCGLLLAAGCNFVMSFCTGYVLMAVVWFVNGFAHAMLWPPIVRLMAMYMNDTEYGYAAVRISAASSIATIVLYVLSPLLLKVLEWNRVIMCISFAGIVISVAWILLNPRLFKKDENILPPVQTATEAASAPAVEKPKNVPLPAMVWLPIVLIFIGIVLQGALRDGVGDWMPTFMADAFELDPESAIITGVVPAVFSILSFTCFDLLHRKLLKNEVTCAGAIFVGSVVLSLILLVVNSFVSSGWFSGIVCALLIGLLVACMHGINLMLITVVPKRFIKSGKVSTFSGLLNAATYVGAAIALPLFPWLKSNFSWGVTIAAWAIISALGAAVCFIVVPMWKKFRKEYSDNPEV
ncbi:MAG: MFS transporter [Clostridia bacterium]|nr:MFS transporter [Clostridia bacterium]